MSQEQGDGIDRRFPKHLHIRRKVDFDAVYKLRCTASDAWLAVSIRPNGLDHARLGLSVSRRYGGAVQRNRLRRLYREAFRLDRHELPSGIDIVMIPRSPNEPTLDVVRTSLKTLAWKLAKRVGR